MVTLHEPDFPSLKVTVLQTADGGNTQLNFYSTPGILDIHSARDLSQLINVAYRTVGAIINLEIFTSLPSTQGLLFGSVYTTICRQKKNRARNLI